MIFIGVCFGFGECTVLDDSRGFSNTHMVDTKSCVKLKGRDADPLPTLRLGKSAWCG